jgi:hypothetical protein
MADSEEQQLPIATVTCVLQTHQRYQLKLGLGWLVSIWQQHLATGQEAASLPQ